MKRKVTVAAKADEVSLRISKLEKEIALVQSDGRDADSIRDKILDLKKQLQFFREVLRNYPTTPPDFRSVC